MSKSGMIGSGRGLSYPDRFHAAASYAGFGTHANIPSKHPPFDSETEVLLYALYHQATVGPCNVPQPRGWNNKVEQGKWNSWCQLGKMANTEAMRLFVKILEEEDPAWLSKVQDHDLGVIEEPQQPRAEEDKMSLAPVSTKGSTLTVPLENGSFGETEDKDILIEDVAAVSGYNKWFSPQVNGRLPPARYQHAAAIVQDKMFVVGGNHNGRYLNDVHVFDLNTKTWSKVEQKPASSSEEGSTAHSFPPCAGHSLIQHGNSLLAVAGHSKNASDTVAVYSFDIERSSWSMLKAYGKSPIARGGQSITKVGSSLVMFGGEDSRRRLLNDLNILDLETMTWDAIEAVGTPPSPRADHTAATVQAGRYLLVFGGGSHSTCFNDLHVLDLETMEWSQPEPRGEVPTPRAGHAGATIGDNWYIVGGGDNKSGVSETMFLDMSTMVWSVVTSVEGRTPIASEGLSVVTTTINGEDILVAFGGYNGRYSNEVNVMKMRAQPKNIESAAFSAPQNFAHPKSSLNGSVAAGVPVPREITQDTRVKEIVVDNTKLNSLIEVKEQLALVLKDKKELEATAIASQSENSTLKEELVSVQSTNAELSKELQSVRGQLSAEQSRCFRLEVETAELMQKLQSMEQSHKELELLRRQKAVSDQAAATAAQRQGSGGLWGWIAGSPQEKPVVS